MKLSLILLLPLPFLFPLTLSGADSPLSNDPVSCPKSSLSSRDPGMAPQFTVIIGLNNDGVAKSP